MLVCSEWRVNPQSEHGQQIAVCTVYCQNFTDPIYTESGAEWTEFFSVIVPVALVGGENWSVACREEH